MGKLLEALADGRLCITGPTDELRTPEHQAACDHAYALSEKFKERLGAEEKEQFEEVLDAIAEEQIFCTNKSMARGFALGMLLMAEASEYTEELLREK